MKIRIFTAIVVLTFVAGSMLAGGVESVLTSDNTLWTVSVPLETTRLELIRRNGDIRETMVVPTTDGADLESDARLAWDTRSGTLFVVWVRSTEGGDEIRLAALHADATWADPVVVALGASKRTGLQVVMTHLREEAIAESPAVETTFLNAAWWKIDGVEAQAEYALMAFESGLHLSTDVSLIAGLDEPSGSSEPEDVGAAVHPPLAMARSGEGVQVIFGESHSTAINRLKLFPHRVAADARLWRPGRSGGASRTPGAKLASADAQPVQAFMSEDRVVLYTPNAQFRYSIFDNGQWTPIRMIELDENLTSDVLLRALRRTVEENTPLEPKPPSE